MNIDKEAATSGQNANGIENKSKDSIILAQTNKNENEN